MTAFRRFTLAAFGLVFLFASHFAVEAKDEWIQVKSKNFLLIGNASEREIRKVGTKLEQFRESFRLLFSSVNLISPVPTNVVVFANDSSYRPFKPKRADGRIDDEIAGYFQSGEDVNYITLSLSGDPKQVYGTIFHEYIHFIVNTNFGPKVPQWFNEGLAEYYQTFEIADDIKIKLGLPQGGHLALLQQGNLMKLEQMLNTTNYQLSQTTGRTRDIFYAQSWGLVHYLTQSGRSGALDKFLRTIASGTDPKSAFQDAFQTTYDKMETELRSYIARNSYNFQLITLKRKLTIDLDAQVVKMDEASANAHLGELLYQSQRGDEAEPYLLAAARLNPGLPLANATLGKLRLSQRKFAEAKGYFEKAIAAETLDHILYYRYANLLSRESRDEYGYVRRIEPATAAKMQEALEKAIAIEPSFADSYELLSFILFANNEKLDTAIAYLQTALKYKPGNLRYLLRIAEIYTRQNKFDEATALAERIARTSDDADIKSRAESLASQIAEQRQFAQRQEAERKSYEARIALSGGTPLSINRVESPRPPTEEETAKQNAHLRMRALNEILRKSVTGEQRVIGSVQKIDCKKRPLVYTIKTATATFAVTSKDFDDLYLRSYDPAAMKNQVGCDANLASFTALITFKGLPDSKASVRGELIALEFVPADFRFMSDEEMRTATLIIYDQPTPSKPDRTPEIVKLTGVTGDIEANRSVIANREIMGALRKPVEGEKREIGFLEQMECTDKGTVYHMRTGTQLLKLTSLSPGSLRIYVFTPDLGNTPLVCGMKPIEFPAVFVYKDGEIFSIEFVPKSFVLL